MELIVETYLNEGEPSSSLVRVRPVNPKYAKFRVFCSKSMRTAWPLGQRFRVQVEWVMPKDRRPYLKMSEEHGWDPVT